MRPTDPLRIRLAQVAAATAAVGVPGAPLEPLLIRFGDALVDRLSISTPGGLDALEISAPVTPPDAEERLDDLLRDAGYDLASVAVADEVREALGEPPVEIGLLAGPRPGPPGVRLTFGGDFASAAIYALLGHLLVDEAVRVAWDRCWGRLAADRADAVTIRWPAPGAEPAIEVGATLSVDAAGQDGFAARVDRLGEALGVAAPLRAWLGGVARALAPRRRNDLAVAFGLSRSALAGWLRVGFPDVPVDVALRLLAQFGPGPAPGAPLGALMGAVGDARDVLDRLDVAIAGDERPRFVLALSSVAPP